MLKWVNRMLVVVCLSGVGLIAAGCGDGGDRPVLRLKDRGFKDVYFVMRHDDMYHLCRKCTLTLDDENGLCDEQGRHLSLAPIVIPYDADALRVRSDGIVCACVDGDWCGMGQLAMVHARRPEGAHHEPEPCHRLWEMGTQVVPNRSDCPRIKPVEWVLRLPPEEPDDEDE